MPKRAPRQPSELGPEPILVGEHEYKCSLCNHISSGKTAKRDCQRHQKYCQIKCDVRENDKKFGILFEGNEFKCIHCTYTTRLREHAFRHLNKTHNDKIPPGLVKIDIKRKVQKRKDQDSDIAIPIKKSKKHIVVADKPDACQVPANNPLVKRVKSSGDSCVQLSVVKCLPNLKSIAEPNIDNNADNICTSQEIEILKGYFGQKCQFRY